MLSPELERLLAAHPRTTSLLTWAKTQEDKADTEAEVRSAIAEARAAYFTRLLPLQDQYILKMKDFVSLLDGHLQNRRFFGLRRRKAKQCVQERAYELATRFGQEDAQEIHDLYAEESVEEIQDHLQKAFQNLRQEFEEKTSFRVEKPKSNPDRFKIQNDSGVAPKSEDEKPTGESLVTFSQRLFRTLIKALHPDRPLAGYNEEEQHHLMQQALEAKKHAHLAKGLSLLLRLEAAKQLPEWVENLNPEAYHALKVRLESAPSTFSLAALSPEERYIYERYVEQPEVAEENFQQDLHTLGRQIDKLREEILYFFGK